MRSSPLTRIVLACSIFLASVSTGLAHAFLDHSDPGVGSTHTVPPKQIRIWFTEALDSALSLMTVTDGAGRQVEQGKATVDAKDPTLLEVVLLPLAPGTYRVTWRAVTLDAHRSEGGFTFAIAQ
ncbi:MAG: copper resistance protein CopC [Stellaceae bacterium]